MAVFVAAGVARHADDVGRVLLKTGDDVAGIAGKTADDIGALVGRADEAARMGSLVDDASPALVRHADDAVPAAVAEEVAAESGREAGTWVEDLSVRTAIESARMASRVAGDDETQSPGE